MEEENFTTPENNVTNESLKRHLTTVTPLSKYLAMVLFVLLPFLGGWIGYTYAPDKIVEVEKVVIKTPGMAESVEKTDDSPLRENYPDTETISYTLSTKEILATYLSPSIPGIT